MEAFDQWCAATERNDATLAATAEEGGPSVSLVPIPVSVPFDPQASRKTGGWSAHRQRGETVELPAGWER